MDTPPAIEEPFEEESLMERIIGLKEMFPEPIRKTFGLTLTKSVSCFKWVFSATRTVTWIACSTAAILVLPISLEKERQEYEEQMKRQERNILLGPETGPNI